MWIPVGQTFEAQAALQLSANGNRLVAFNRGARTVYEWQAEGAVWGPLGSSPLGVYYILHLSATGNSLAVYDDSRVLP
jgi:hypothetical protein